MASISQQLDDRALIQEYLLGNENAFETLLLRHKDRVYRAIFVKVRDAELTNDLFQDTFIKVINTLKGGSYNEEGKFLPWILRIANNLVIDYFRRNNRMRMVRENSSATEEFNIFSVLKQDDLNVLEQWSKEELEEQMVNLLQHLPDNQREIVEQRIFQDLSFKEIAENDKVSINTALGRMRYALINLRKLIEENELVTEY